MYFYLWYVFRCTLIFIFRSVRCNSEYQVNVIKHVRYVAWAISSRAIVKIHLYMFKKKKKNESSQWVFIRVGWANCAQSSVMGLLGL
jgi:hypothetical protein